MFRRLIKEAVFIRASDDGSLMYLDKEIPINSCWTEFNGIVRQYMKKRRYVLGGSPSRTFPQVNVSVARK